MRRLRVVDGEILGADDDDVVPLGKFQIGIAHHEAVLDRGDPRLRGVVRTGTGPGVGRETESRASCLVLHEADVVGAVDVALVVDDDLDHRGAEVDVLAHRLEHLVTGVGEEVFRFREARLVGLQVELAAIRRDDPPGREHRGSGDHSLLDRTAHLDAGEVALVADVAHRGEAGFEHGPGVDDALDGAIGVGVPQGGEVVVAGIAARLHLHAEVGVGIDQPGRDRRRREVDHAGTHRDSHVAANRRDAALLDQDHLVPGGGTGVGIDDGTGANGGDLGEGGK